MEHLAPARDLRYPKQAPEAKKNRKVARLLAHFPIKFDVAGAQLLFTRTDTPFTHMNLSISVTYPRSMIPLSRGCPAFLVPKQVHKSERFNQGCVLGAERDEQIDPFG